MSRSPEPFASLKGKLREGEGSLRPSSQTLRCAQGDRYYLQMSTMPGWYDTILSGSTSAKPSSKALRSRATCKGIEGCTGQANSRSHHTKHCLSHISVPNGVRQR